MISLSYPQISGRRLRRNHLRTPAGPDRLVDVVRDTCGIQAQVPAAAELAISARVSSITREDVRDALWKQRTLVRTSATRDTKHILPSDELPLWMAAMRAAVPLRPRQNQPRYSPEEMARIVRYIKEALDGVILSREELAAEVSRRMAPGQNGKANGSGLTEALRSSWGELFDRAFYEGAMLHGPSESDQGNQAAFARPDQWLGSWQDLDPTESLTEVCRRYVSSYGPVTHGDFARWFWITPDAASRIFDSIRDELEEVKVERRRAWILASDALDAAWAPVEGSVRLVPQYDCYLLGSYPREPIVPDSLKAFLRTLKRATYEGAVGLPLLLIDGVVSGIWERRQRGRRGKTQGAKLLEITVSPVVTLTPRQREQIESEAARIGAFLGSEVILQVAPAE